MAAPINVRLELSWDAIQTHGELSLKGYCIQSSSSFGLPVSPKLTDSAFSTSSSIQMALSTMKPATYTWEIPDFASKTSEITSSTAFESPDKPEIRFDLLLKPKNKITLAYSHICQEHVSIMLRRWDGSMAKCSVRYRIAIINAKDEHCLAQDHFATFHKLAVGSRGTLTNSMFVINRDYLLDRANGLLVNGSLKVYCEVHFLDEQLLKPDVPADQLLHKVSEDFESLLENCKFSDVTLVVGNKELKAHKLILVTRSPVFEAMFGHDCKEVNEGKVNIPDVQVDTFEELLRYIYTGKINDPKKYALDLLVAADKYQMSSLKDYCEQYLMVNLSIDSSCETLLIADLLQVSQLKVKCLEFINTNVNAVMATDGWKRMADEKRFDLVAELYQNLGTKNSK